MLLALHIASSYLQYSLKLWSGAFSNTNSHKFFPLIHT